MLLDPAPRECSAFPDASPYSPPSSSRLQTVLLSGLWQQRGPTCSWALASAPCSTPSVLIVVPLALAPLFSLGLPGAHLPQQSCTVQAPHVCCTPSPACAVLLAHKEPEKYLSMSFLIITLFNVFLSRMSMLTHKWEFQIAEYSP